MALKQRIQDDLKAALLGGDRFVAETLRGLKAAILNEEVAQGKRDEGLSDAESEAFMLRLALLLANQIGDQQVLLAAIATARELVSPR